MSNQISQSSQQSNYQTHLINIRYAHDVVKYIQNNSKLYEIQLDRQKLSQSQQIQFRIKPLFQTNQNKYAYYYNILKKFYQIRKIGKNPQQQLTFVEFIAIYHRQLQLKLKQFQFNSKQAEKHSLKILNNLLLKNQLNQIQQHLTLQIRRQKPKIQSLQKEYSQIKKQYINLTSKLTERNAQLQVQNVEYLIMEKQQQKKKNNFHTRKFLKNQKGHNPIKGNIKGLKKIDIQSNIKFSEFKPNKQKTNSDPAKQQLQRIKTIIQNNMWGYGDKIKDRLNHLKNLKNQISSVDS